MSNCPGCDNSSTTYSRCNPPVSTNCVFYQGESKVCPHDDTFTICKGDNLSNVQLDIFNKVCELAGDLNITSIEFPCSLQDAWEDQDPTILNLLQYMVDIQCEQKTLLEEVASYVNNKTPVGGIKIIDPFVKVCLACCTPGCTTDTPVVLLLSEALEAMVTCICVAKDQAKEALEKAEDALSKAACYEKNIEELNYKYCSVQNANLANYNTISAIITELAKPPFNITISHVAPASCGTPPPPCTF